MSYIRDKLILIGQIKENIQRMQKNYICKSDIKTLKADLMGKRRRSNRSNRNAKNNSFYSNRSMSNISSQYFSLRNDEIGQDFEENIRNILIMDYNWKESNIKRKFKFREISYRFKKLYIITGQKKRVFINQRIVNFQFNDDGSIDITSRGRTVKIRGQEEKRVFFIKVGVITLKKVQEVEIDGMFNIENFSSTAFDPEEITILYRNINDNKMQLFTQAILEIKLSKNNFCGMVTQLIRDRDIFEKLIKKPILYIGFINSKYIEKGDLKALKDGLNKLNNCIIFGIKNKIFSGKNVNKFYNWRGIEKFNKLEEDVKLLGKKVYEIEDEVKEIKNEVKEIKNEVKEIKNEVNQLKDSQDELKNIFQNFALQYEINNKIIFDKLNQMNSEQKRNDIIN